MKARRGLLLLLGIALLFAVTKLLPKGGAGAAARPGRSEEVLGEEGRSPSRARRGSARLLEPPVLALVRLEAAPTGETLPIGRNLFRYGAPKTAQPPPGVPAVGPGGRPGIWRPGGGAPPTPPPTELTPPQPPVPPKPQPPPVTVRYLGAFGPKGKSVAVFTDGDEIYDVFEGETFASRYILRRINLETVELGFTGFPDDIIEKLEVGP